MNQFTPFSFFSFTVIRSGGIVVSHHRSALAALKKKDSLGKNGISASVRLEARLHQSRHADAYEALSKAEDRLKISR